MIVRGSTVIFAAALFLAVPNLSMAQVFIDGSADAIDPQERADLVSLVTKDLRDPVASQFRNVRPLDPSTVGFYCGEINYKNQHGGYDGFRPFWANLPEGKHLIRIAGKESVFDAVSGFVDCFD